MFPEAARVFFHTSKYFVTWIPYSVACAFINFSFHPPSAHSAVIQVAETCLEIGFETCQLRLIFYQKRPFFFLEINEGLQRPA